MKKIIISLVLLIILTVSTAAFANSGQLVGLGHNFVSLEGSAALLANPALTNPTDDKFTLELNGKADVWNNGINSKYFNQYIDESEKNDILDKVSADGLVLMGKGDQDIRLIMGPVALFGGVKESGLGTLSKDIVELLLKGNEIGQNYKLSGTDLSSAVYADAGINFSFPVQTIADKININNFKVGATYHYLYGGIYKFIGEGEARLDYDQSSADGYIDMQYSEECTGSAFDIGASFEVNDKLTIGTSIVNLGSLKAENPKHSKLQFVVDEDNEEMVDVKESEEEAMEGELKYKLPRQFKIGAKYAWNEKLDILFDYAHISYDIAKTEHKMALAGEFTPIGILPLRMGVNYSTLQQDFILSGGMGLYLGPLQFDLGFSDLSALAQNAKSVEGGLSVRMAF